MTTPNLLIIMVDQTETALLDRQPPPWSKVHLLHLSALRDRAFQFDAAYCPAPICTPCRASFQLGESVERHGVTTNGIAMPADRRTLADRFGGVGYDTAYVGKWHLDPDADRGWKHLDRGKTRRPIDTGQWTFADPDKPFEAVAPYGQDDHLDGQIAAAAHDQLDRLQAGAAPFALMVSFFGPHAPYFVPEPWHSAVDPDDVPLPEGMDDPLEGKPDIQRAFRCRAWGEQFDDAKWRRIRAAYFGYCLMLDHFIGRLLAQIDRDSTAVLFLSDHGEMNGHHRMIFKGPMMYEPLVRVPGLLALPQQTAGAAVPGLVNTMHLTATLLGLADAGTVPDGVDLAPSLRTGQPEAIGRDHVVSTFYEANWVAPVCRQRVAMIRDARWKYIVTEGRGEELYDMQARPLEVENLVGRADQQSRRKAFRQQLSHAVPWVDPNLQHAPTV